MCIYPFFCLYISGLVAGRNTIITYVVNNIDIFDTLIRPLLWLEEYMQGDSYLPGSYPGKTTHWLTSASSVLSYKEYLKFVECQQSQMNLAK